MIRSGARAHHEVMADMVACARWVACRAMSSPLAVTSLDHVALWVADRDAIADLACEHLGMHVIERTEKFTLVGADARRVKLTLFAAEGPREPGALVAVILRVERPRGGARRAARRSSSVERRDDGVVLFDGARGPARSGSCERETDLDYDLDHVVLRVEDAEASAAALGRARLRARRPPAARRRQVGRRSRAAARRRASGRCSTTWPCWSTRPRRSSARRARAAPRSPTSSTPPNTLAVFVWTPGRIKLEYVEHKPSFSLV